MNEYGERDSFDFALEERELIANHTKVEHQELVELQAKVREYGKSLNHFEELLSEHPEDVGIKLEGSPEEKAAILEKEFVLLQRRFNDIQDLVTTGFEIEMHQRFDELEEKTHTDCIKVYRNVQAVVVEELSKQNKVLIRDDKAISKIKRRMNVVLAFSIVSVVTAVVLIILEILPIFGIKLF